MSAPDKLPHRTPHVRVYWNEARDGNYILQCVTLDLGSGEVVVPVHSISHSREREKTFLEVVESVAIEGDWSYDDVLLGDGE